MAIITSSNSQFGYGGFGKGNFGSAPPMMLPYGYYLNLLTSEYKLATQLNSWMSLVLGVYQDAAFLFSSFVTAFDITYAVGDQLDVLGVLVGVSRTVSFQPSDSVSATLDDDTYRIVLLAKNAQNHWDGKMSSMYSIWKTLFPGGNIVIHDNQNMTATIFLTGSFSSIILDLVAGFALNGATSGTIKNGYIIPKPETVQYDFEFGTLPAFGFDHNDDYISGFDYGHWE
jgi:hypothetical protein